MSEGNQNDTLLSELARRATTGDAQATEQLFLRLLPRVRNLVRYLVRGDRDVDDLSQDALVAILRGIGTYRSEGPFRAWVDRIVARSVFSNLKRRNLPHAVNISELVTEHAASADTYLLRRQVVALLDQIPEPQRLVLVLHHALGLTIPEVAIELVLPEETVRSRLRLGKERLRLAFGDQPQRQGVG